MMYYVVLRKPTPEWNSPLNVLDKPVDMVVNASTVKAAKQKVKMALLVLAISHPDSNMDYKIDKIEEMKGGVWTSIK